MIFKTMGLLGLVTAGVLAFIGEAHADLVTDWNLKILETGTPLPARVS
jgi:hypothetical protein